MELMRNVTIVYTFYVYVSSPVFLILKHFPVRQKKGK